ncbi:MAG TPA: YkgJ family cysteine cluster protein [Candidatus Sulfotelmatobacter sp.]|nr:YkgJ family cysteine cluster protein [Candidatus Sulfotelmatobacter sp.]
MNFTGIITPNIQNWSCHGCTDCCRGGLLITLQPEDKQRIEEQNWTPADGIDPAKAVVRGLNHFRLGHQPDGACVFLDSQGRCKIHAKFGEAAKPLACRLYPLVVHPAGKKLLVGLRFSCPSAAANKGVPMSGYAAGLAKLAKTFLPDNCDEFPPPAVAATAGLDWPDFMRFTRWLDKSLADETLPMALKILRALQWLGTVEKSYFDQIEGDSADDILGALVENSSKKIPELPESPEKPSAFGRLFLRMMVLEHARIVTVADTDVRSSHRWKMLAAAARFVWSAGSTPALSEELKRVKFSDIEKNFAPLSAGAEALLTRYFCVKVQSLHFCGRAFHNRPFIEGFRNLALLYPVIVWLARWLALSAGQPEVADADVLRAVSLVDHHYSYTPYLAWRTKLLQQRNDIAKLCEWYAR